ncbi:MAG: indolepyruvate oxidoreductase subunit beta [Victivallaceae bacterium]
MSDVKNIIFAGLGGQGVLKSTDILAEALFSAGFDVKKSEVHGMSQRGGSVSSEVRFGSKVNSPMVPEGECDYLVVIDQTQVEVNADKISDKKNLITPDDFDVKMLENPRSINVALLGVLAGRLSRSGVLNIPCEKWYEAIKDNFAPKLHEINIRAFDNGFNAK